MLIKKISSLGVLFLSLSVLYGCASKPPTWFDQSVQDTATDYVTVSRGLSMYDAKQKGLMQITQKLSTKVDSTVKIRDAGITLDINGEEETRSYGYTDISINSTTAKLPLNGIQVVDSEINDSGAYIKLKISKASIKLQMENELQHYEEHAQAQLKTLKSQDKLEWWIQNRNINQFIAEVKIRISVLATVNPDKRYSAPISLTYADTVASTKNSILVLISAKSTDSQKAKSIADFISQQEIATTQNNYPNATHIIELRSTYNTGRIGKYYKYTSDTNLSVTSKKQQKTVASNKITSTGSSPNSIEMAKIGDSHDFSKQIKDSGVWKSLGFSIK